MTDANYHGQGKGKAFFQNLPASLSLSGGDVEWRLLMEYGAVFLTAATPPDRVVYRDESDVSRFQDTLDIATADLGGYSLQLQASAMEALLAAILDADSSGLTISPRGTDSAARTYSQTVDLWTSRVEPAVTHWTRLGMLTSDDAERLLRSKPFDQVKEVFRHEANGIYFAKDLSKSIIYSVAPPGSSQHLSLLAFDVAEFSDPNVRSILANHGWFQTVVSDLPHFTYIGRMKEELSKLGLKLVEFEDQEFWVPDAD